MRRRARLAALLALALLAAPAAAGAQVSDQSVRQRQEELNRIREERRALEERMRQLQGTVHDLSEEVTNLDRQAAVTARVVASLDGQLRAITGEVDDATGKLVNAEDELAAKRAALQRRLVEIYKRGPMYTAEALLSAESFAELIARYKYLHILAQRDRALVRRMEQLRDQVDRQRGVLVRLQDEMLVNRQEKAAEEQRLRALQQQQRASLARVRRTAAQTRARLEQIARDERRVTQLLASLEASRKRSEAARPRAARGASTLTTSSLGTLDWPVDGSILYSFGRVVNPNNTKTRWNGLGIAAPAGTPVRAVAAGEIVIAEAFGTYGLTVIVQHPGGDYSVYGSLERMDVKKGQSVKKGEVLGTVGSADPELPPHLHFEVRPGGRAVDPLEWLRARR